MSDSLYKLRPRQRVTWRFSLRTGFVLLTLLCVWLAVIAARAERQKRAVEALQASGAFVRYQVPPESREATSGQRFWQQISGWIGRDYVYQASEVFLSGRLEKYDESLTRNLKDLPNLKTIQLHNFRRGDGERLEAAFPRVRIYASVEWSGPKMPQFYEPRSSPPTRQVETGTTTSASP